MSTEMLHESVLDYFCLNIHIPSLEQKVNIAIMKSGECKLGAAVLWAGEKNSERL